MPKTVELLNSRFRFVTIRPRSMGIPLSASFAIDHCSMLEIRPSRALSAFPRRSVPLKGGRRGDFGSGPLFIGYPDLAVIAPVALKSFAGWLRHPTRSDHFRCLIGGTALATQIEGHFLGASHSVGFAGFSRLPGRDRAFGVTPAQCRLRRFPAPAARYGRSRISIEGQLTEAHV
jgi:hypothetical protein